jgi:hypothetical protein
VSIDRAFGRIRRWDASDAAAYEGARLREALLDKSNTAGAAYRPKANEGFLAKNGFVSRIHRKKPSGRPMPDTTPSQRPEIKSPIPGRACLRRAEGRACLRSAEGQEGPLHPHDRHRQGDDEDAAWSTSSTT